MTEEFEVLELYNGPLSLSFDTSLTSLNVNKNTLVFVQCYSGDRPDYVLVISLSIGILYSSVHDGRP